MTDTMISTNINLNDADGRRFKLIAIQNTYNEENERLSNTYYLLINITELTSIDPYWTDNIDTLFFQEQ